MLGITNRGKEGLQTGAGQGITNHGREVLQTGVGPKKWGRLVEQNLDILFYFSF